jgi:hypothetical protein
VKASRPAPKPANSCARRCITSAKANMAQPLRNRRLLSDSRRRVAQVSSCPRHAEVKRPPAPARKPRAIFVKAKATPGALLPPGGQGPPRMLKRGRDILPLPMHLSPNRLEPPLAIEDHLCAEVLRGKQAGRASTQEGNRKAINPYSQPAKSIESLSLEYQRFLPCLVIGLERARLQPRPSRSFIDEGLPPLRSPRRSALHSSQIIFFAGIYNIDCSDSNIAFDSPNKISNDHSDSGSRRRILVSAAPTTLTVLGCSPPQSEI